MKMGRLILVIVSPIIVGFLIINYNSATLAANRSPVVNNVRAAQRLGSHLIDISYDLEDADNDQLTISIEVSNDGGKSFIIIPKSLSGDVGSNVRVGKGKKIVWDAGVDMPNAKGSNFQIKVIADDGKGPSNTIIGKDGAEMVLIPAGEFLMGSPEGEGSSDERPQHTVYLDAFYIDKYEVTNAHYKKFMDATGHAAPSYWNDNRFNKPGQPVVGVSWFDAEAYCKWSGKRLPTEAEWEKAARGMDGRKYPWGNEAPNAGGIWRANYYIGSNGAGDGFQYTAPVGSFPAGASPYGVMDMAGNVWEWVADWYDENYYKTGSNSKYNPKGPNSGSYKVLRGGSWGGSDGSIRAASRYDLLPPTTYTPVYAVNGLGFRCVSSVP